MDSFAEKLLKSLNIKNESSKIEFYQLEQLLIDFIKDNQKKGLRNPLLAELTISKSNDGFRVKMNSYYKEISSNNFINQEKSKLFEIIMNIPNNLLLKIQREGKLIFKFKEILDLLSSDNEKVYPMINFNDIEYEVNEINKSLKNFRATFIKVQIEDRLFKKHIQITFENESKNLEIRSKSFIEITNLPTDLNKMIELNGSVEFEIK